MFTPRAFSAHHTLDAAIDKEDLPRHQRIFRAHAPGEDRGHLLRTAEKRPAHRHHLPAAALRSGSDRMYAAAGVSMKPGATTFSGSRRRPNPVCSRPFGTSRSTHTWRCRRDPTALFRLQSRPRRRRLPRFVHLQTASTIRGSVGLNDAIERHHHGARRRAYHRAEDANPRPSPPRGGSSRRSWSSQDRRGIGDDGIDLPAGQARHALDQLSASCVGRQIRDDIHIP